MEVLINLSKEIAVFLVIAYLFSKTPVFKLLLTQDYRLRDSAILYLIFTGMAIIGTYFGIPVHGAIANNRVIGAAIAGLLGGPAMGFGVGFTAGLHRYFLGGFTALSCGISTTVEGLFAGLVHSYFFKKGKSEKVFDPSVAFAVTFVAEVLQMIIILIISKPQSDAVDLIKIIAMPMIVSNSIGAGLIISMFRDQRYHYDKIGSIYSSKALNIAKKLLGELSNGLNEQSAKKIGQIIFEDTGVAAVSITNTEKVLSFIGIGDDHHRTGVKISGDTVLKKAISSKKIVFLDGKENKYICPYTENCRLNSVLIVPIKVKDEVIGTIKLYGEKNKIFFRLNETLGRGIAELIEDQLIAARYEKQKSLLKSAELDLIQAQINPHFLFNAINTIIAVSRINVEKARELLVNLSTYFRSNLKRKSYLSTIEEELAHVNSYLEIEKARFNENLIINTEIDNSLLNKKVPTFTLQPLVENAIKHGISKLLEKGEIYIRAYRNNGNIQIEVEDNAGVFEDKEDNSGLGLNIVDKRIKNMAGENYGIEVICEKDIRTTVLILLPKEGIEG